MLKIKVCDAVMGAGKTQAAITRMNEDDESNFLFVTPYLDETERVQRSCPKRRFVLPDTSRGTKLESIRVLLQNQRNIASTHALFYRYDEDVLQAVREGEYVLILDEVVDVVQTLDVPPDDIDALFGYGMLSVDENGRVTWIGQKVLRQYEKLREIIDTGYVTFEDQKMLLWKLPIELFEVFKEVIILTYMFDCQPQAYYFNLCGVEIEKIGVDSDSGVYRFSSSPSKNKLKLPEVHIITNKSLNEVGAKRTALSSSWHRDNKYKPPIETLRKNLYNVMRNMFGAKSNQCLWTTFKDTEEVLAGKGFKKAFLPCNARATNEYADRKYLAYLVNRFMDPNIKLYFTSHGVEVDEDAWALSEMIQWIWRSAIRKGEEIWIYVPSSRMRGLLQKWIAEVSEQEGSDSIPNIIISEGGFNGNQD